MQQNKYDDPEFFERYSQMLRSAEGLDAAGEWPAFRALLPEFAGKSVLDLGCGFGWHCRYARAQGARQVIGVDASQKMLARAIADTNDPGIEYKQSAIEDAEFESGQFDLVLSSLAFHYLEIFDVLCRKIFNWLAAGGSFVFSVEHPMFTALAAQEWCLGPAGERRHWPVDDYQDEGIRHTNWMAGDVVKYHRTTASYVNNLIDCGFGIARLVEPSLAPERLARRPEWNDENRRPMFLLISAVKGDPRAGRVASDGRPSR
jgi:SAM-dependent methyltransferase